MGLLEEAIREHLELKRAHGADPGEIARAEREALGPVTRGSAAAPADVEPDAVNGDSAVAAADAVEPEPQSDELFDEAYTEPEPLPRSDDLAVDQSALDQHTQAMDPPFPVEPEPAEPEPAPEPPAADAPAADVEPEPTPGQSEDVLEETPEFLQEAPEHDRLWFEQKPPRDFDFDG